MPLGDSPYTLKDIYHTGGNMTIIKNPILKGFNPDPSICRVGQDYYIATSTFEWFPGVQIHHSRDLVNWKLVTRPLDRVEQLDMRGNPDSCGIWAPCLSYSDGKFYLIFTDVKCYQSDYKTAHNYLVTADDIAGPWSNPIHLNSSGFDPSLFHDDDGKKWFLNVLWDHRPENSRLDKRPAKSFNGILLQEYDIEKQSLVGPIKNIYSGTPLGLVEGPHIYKFNGYYYLLTAEGGTFAYHAAGFARSKTIDGLYENDPEGHIITSNGSAALLRRSGHASMVTIDEKHWAFVHLCGRPLPHRGRCVLGRETALQIVTLNAKGWPRLATGNNFPNQEVTLPPSIDLAPSESKSLLIDEFDDFDSDILRDVYQTLRQPLNKTIMSLEAKAGTLMLVGKEFIGSLYTQALVGRRQEHINFTATTRLEFQPETFQQMAGITSYYNSQKYIYFYVSVNDHGQRILEVIMANVSGNLHHPLGESITLPATGAIDLRIDVEGDQWKAYYAVETSEHENSPQWINTNITLDYSILSDEFGTENFTGAFIALCCQDVSGANKPAYFHHFSYKEYDLK